MAAVAVFSVGTQTSYAESTVLTPTQTTKIQGDGETTTNSDNVFYDASATSWTCSQSKVSGGAFSNTLSKDVGSPVVITKFDASSTLAGKILTKATLQFTSVCTVSGKNSNVQVAKINTGWDAATASWNSTNTAAILGAVNIDEVTNGVNVKTSAKTITLDVTEYLKANADNTIGFGIYTYTAREQKISDLSLSLEYIDASASANYTVKYVDENGNELKSSQTYVGTIGTAITLNDDDKAPVYNEDKTVKYVYDSDDIDGKTVAKDGSVVVTVKFRKAATWNYTFKAVDSEGTTLQEEIVKGSNFEGETFSVAYPYAINVDGTLYTAKKLSSDGKGYYLSFSLTEANQVKEITYSASDTKDVVYFSEAENIEGLTRATNGNTAIRSSNGASAYAAEADVEFTKLPAGKYKLTATICDATTKHNSQWAFLAGNDTIFKYTPTAVNWATGTSEEFTLNAETPIYLAKGGNATTAVDFIYIQKTGEVTPVTPSYPEGDVTANYLVNPGFESCEAATGNVATANSAQGTDYEAQGWKLIASSAWSNSAVFAYGSDAQLNGVAVPAADNAGNTGNALGVTVGWSGSNVYQSAAEVTLPAGSYTLKAYGYNAGTAAQFVSKLAFVAADKTYASEKKSFTLGQWEADEVAFVLDAETTGKFQIGGAAVNAGSGAHGKVFFDNITLERKDLLNGARATLAAEVAAAEELAKNGLAPKTDLEAAIATAKAAAENTDYKEVLAAAEALKAAAATYADTNTHFVQLNDVKTKYAPAEDAYPYASAEKTKALSDAIAKASTTADEADAQKTEIIAAARAYVESNAKAEGVEGAVDYTSFIQNSNAESMDGWTLTNAAGSNGSLNIKSNEPFTDADGNNQHAYFDGGNWGAESWDVTFTQTVRLPKGKYLLSVTSRAATDMSTFALFADSVRAEMPHVGASGELFDRGWNDSHLVFEVAGDTADVDLGVQGAVSVIHNWMSFTRFRLVQIGQPAVENPVATVENIGELLQQKADEDEGLDVKLKLTDAKITVCKPGLVILEDATGAIQLSSWYQEAQDGNLLPNIGEFRDSVALNGYLYGNFNNPNSLFVSDSTSASVITVTPTTLTPTATTVAGVQKPENALRLFEIKDATVEVGDMGFAIKQGDATLNLYDLLGIIPTNEEGTPTMPDKLESIDGVLMYIAAEEEGETATYYFLPTAFKEELIVVKPVEGKYVFLPTEENVAAAKAEGWIKGADTRVDNKKGDIDPATGEAIDKAKAFPGIGVKKGTATKTLTLYVTGVDKFVVYATSTSTSAERYLNVKAVNVDDADDNTQSAVKVVGNTTTKDEVELFDNMAIYAITFEGLESTEDGQPNYDKGGDVAIHGITFNPDKGGATGINGINATVISSEDVYTVNGTVVRKAGESLKGLTKGVYIIGGKKIVVK